MVKQSKYNVWVNHNGWNFVYNGLSGGLIRLSSEEKEALLLECSTNENCAYLDEELKKDLMVGQILLDDNFCELSELEGRFSFGKSNNECFSLTVITSLGCNFDCPYCYELKTPQVLSKQVADGIVEIISKKVEEVNKIQIHWLGGEPLIGLRQIEYLSRKILDLCNGKAEFVSFITTNGSLLKRETAILLKGLGLKRAQITLDGPPETHNKMRPAANGSATFDTILANIKDCADIIDIVIRVNLDKENVEYIDELLHILKSEGLSSKVEVYAGHLVKVDDGVSQPSALYKNPCFTTQDFSPVEMMFNQKALDKGFSTRILDGPVLTPCMAVRSSEFVVGSQGELYKCWKSVGISHEEVGNIFQEPTEPQVKNEEKWVNYSPFNNTECLNCIALPVCMGGCARLALDPALHPDRCNTFRYEHKERVLQFVKNLGF